MGQIRKLKRTCAACGKKGVVEIEVRTRKIIGGWWYYGEIDLNQWKETKKLLELQSNKDGSAKHNSRGDLVWKEIVNSRYQKDAKPRLVEYWEHKRCSTGKR